MYTTAAVNPPAAAQQAADDEEDEEDEEEEEEAESDSEAEMDQVAGRQPGGQNTQGVVGTAEQSELMQLEMSEDIRLGSPDDGSNNLDSDFHMLTVNNQAGKINLADHQRRINEFRAESSRRWQVMQDPMRSTLQTPPSGNNSICR